MRVEMKIIIFCLFCAVLQTLKQKLFALLIRRAQASNTMMIDRLSVLNALAQKELDSIKALFEDNDAMTIQLNFDVEKTIKENSNIIENINDLISTFIAFNKKGDMVSVAHVAGSFKKNHWIENSLTQVEQLHGIAFSWKKAVDMYHRMKEHAKSKQEESADVFSFLWLEK